MIEKDFFNSENNTLSYACTIPDGQRIKAGIIFVHAADGNRLGPHRMFVELANKLKDSGIISFRFDMRGCGDSQGRPARDGIDFDIEDLLNAIDFFISKYKPPKIFLFGISRGARIIFSALAEHSIPVGGAVLLSIPFSSTKAAARSFSSHVREYIYKFRDPQSLKKFLTGKVNFKQIIKTLSFALGSFQRYRRNNNEFATRCPLFFIYGSKDPVATDSQIHYGRICKKYKVLFKIIKIKNANHSFFHYQWKEQILCITEEWLMENVSNGENNVSPS